MRITTKTLWAKSIFISVLMLSVCFAGMPAKSSEAPGSLVDRMNAELAEVLEAAKLSEPLPDSDLFKNNPAEYQKQRNEWLKGFQDKCGSVRSKYQKLDPRFDNITKSFKDAGLGECFINSGSKPKTPASDIDITEVKPGSVKKLIEKGYPLVKDPNVPGRYTDPGQNLVIWETPPDMKVNSRQWKEWVRARAMGEDTFTCSGALYETSGGKMGTKDPAGAVLDNVKKAMEAGLNKDPGGNIDSKTLGKSVKKASDWSRSKPLSEAERSFLKEAEMLQKGMSWEEAGIVSPNDKPEARKQKINEWQKKAGESLEKSYKTGKAESAKLTDQRYKEMSNIANKPADKWTAADKERWGQLNDELHSINKTNNETMRKLATDSPETAAKLRGKKITVNSDGTITEHKIVKGKPVEKTITKSEFADKMVGKSAQKLITRTSDGKLIDTSTGRTLSNKEFLDRVKSGSHKFVLPDKPTAWSKTKSFFKGELPSNISPRHAAVCKGIRVGGTLLILYQAYQGFSAYADYLHNAAMNDPENFGLKTVAEGVWVGTKAFLGLPALEELVARNASKYGFELTEAYLKAKAEGKEWWFAPEYWAGAYLTGDVLKEIAYGITVGTYEAIKGTLSEGFGVIVDYNDARKAAQQALDMKNRLDEKYKPLSSLMEHFIGGPLPPIWDKNRFKYYQIFKPILDDPAALEKLMKTPMSRDLWNALKEYKDRRAKPLGITFGTPGADNPDDNDNIGKALMALPAQERGLYLKAAGDGNKYVTDFITSRDKSLFTDELDPETLGAFLSASRSDEKVSFDVPLSPEQVKAVTEVYKDMLMSVAAVPNIAILGSGYARGVAALLGSGTSLKPAVLIQPDDNLDALDSFRLLIIPSGALSDWYMSKKLRSAIERFAESGGTVLVLAQQLGQEYAAIPGNVSAYGFAEDQSCQYASSKITISNRAFASMQNDTPNFNVDGYFLEYPPESEIWLTRTKNNQPCMISYPYGEGKIVLASMYLDWAAGNHQGTEHERLFFRDLIPSLLDDAQVFLSKAGEDISIPIPQPDEGTAGKTFKPFIMSPDGSEVQASPAPSDGKLTLAGLKTGFYYMGGTFLDSQGKAVGELLPKVRFAVSAQPDVTSCGSEAKTDALDASIASDMERYIRGAEAHFKILLWNRGSTHRKISVSWKFPHNASNALAAERSRYVNSVAMTIQPQSKEEIPISITIVNTDGIDRLWASVHDETENRQINMSKGFYTSEARAKIDISLSKQTFSKGEAMQGDAEFNNPYGVNSAGTLRLSLVDSAGKSHALPDVPFEAEAEKVRVPLNIVISEDIYSGECALQAFAVLRGSMVGFGVASFNFRSEPKPFKGIVTDYFTDKNIRDASLSFRMGGETVTISADKGGQFEFMHPEGRCTVEGKADGYNLFTESRVLSSAESEDIKIIMLPTDKGLGLGSVQGRVFDRISNETVSGQLITFVKGDKKIQLKSDYSGRYSTALLPGDYEVICPIEGHVRASSSFPLRVYEGWTQPFDLYVPIGKLEMKVLDIITGKPVKDVSAIFRTDDKSTYDGWNKDVSSRVNTGEVIRTDAGNRNLRISAEGYHPLETGVNVGEKFAIFTFYLKPKLSPVKVLCLDSVTQKPISGLTVKALRSGREPTATGATDELGTYCFNLEEGRWVIEAETEIYHKAVTEAYIQPNSAKEPVEVTMFLKVDTKKKPGDTKILVMDVIDGKPLEGVIITSAVEGVSQVVTDKDGIAILKAPDGRTVLKFQRDNYDALETDLLVCRLNENTEEFFMTPQKAKRNFIVRDIQHGDFIEGAKISIKAGNKPTPLGASGSDGALEAELPRGRVMLLFEKDGYSALETEFYCLKHAGEPVVSDEVYLSPLKSRYPYIGLIKGSDGNPISGASVILKQNKDVFNIITSAKGKFSQVLSLGLFELTIKKDGFHELKTQAFMGGWGKDTEPEEYFLYPSSEPYPAQQGNVEFSVRDAFTGALIPSFKGYILGSAWTAYEKGFASAKKDPGNRDTAFEAPDYYKTGGFSPTVFPGRTVKRTVHMWPKSGKVEFNVLDAITSEPISNFWGYLMENGWIGYENGFGSVEKEPGNRNTAFEAPGYYKIDSFYPTVFPGQTVKRTVHMWPKSGKVEFNVLDAMTGEPISNFWGYLMDNGWIGYENGFGSVEKEPGGKNTAFEAPDYYDTGSFLPAAFPGRTVKHTVNMWPSSGKVEFKVLDLMTGEPVPDFSGYLLENGWTGYENGIASVKKEPGNKNTVLKASGYYETGSFYPTAFSGRTAEHTVFLYPEKPRGALSLKAVDAVSGLPVNNVTITPSGEKALQAIYGEASYASEAHFKRQWFRASAPGYKNVDAQGFLTMGRQDLTLVIPMERSIPDGRGSLRVSVIDSDGSPAVGAKVLLALKDSIAQGTTGKSGSLTFKNVPSGVRTAAVQKEGYSQESFKVAVTGGEAFTKEIALTPLSELSVKSPFNPVIIYAPNDETLKPGVTQNLKVILENRGELGGMTFCTLSIPDIARSCKEVLFEPGERKEITFEVTPPEDCVNSRTVATVTAEGEVLRGNINISAPVFSMTASTDKEAYLEGESLKLTVSVKSQEALNGEYQVRATFNDESRVQTVKLKDGCADAVFDDIPVSFKGNKLLYALYHTSGRSILINALPVYDDGAELLIMPDKQQYAAGETIRLSLRGKPDETVMLSSPLLPKGSGQKEGTVSLTLDTDGSAVFDVAAPSVLPTGTYEFNSEKASLGVDIRGYETRILYRSIKEDAQTGALLLSWQAATRGDIKCKWTVTYEPDGFNIFDEFEEDYSDDEMESDTQIIAEGNITLNDGTNDYMLSVKPEAEGSGMVLTLTPEAGTEPLAVIRYAAQ